MIRALVYLRLHSLKNRLRTRLRRLKEPKYLIGGIVGLVYLWAVFLRNVVGAGMGLGKAGASKSLEGDWVTVFELWGAWALLVVLAAFWIFPSRRAALDFTEAEIQFLFPAPVSRRGLLHYKLFSWQLGLLFTSLMVSFFTGRLLQLHGAWMSILGWWLTLLFIQLHGLGASFARTLLLDWGLPQWKRRLAAAAGLLVILGATLAWGWSRLPAFPAFADWNSLEPELLREWFESVSAMAPMSWLLAPLRCVTRLAITHDVGAFVGALPVVLGLVVLHYLWVLQSKVAFEEASVEAARTVADRLAAGGRTRGAPARVRSARSRARRGRLFELGSGGAPWVALGWKNLIAAGVHLQARTFVVLLAASMPALIAVFVMFQGSRITIIVGSAACFLLAVSMLVGPAMVRYDFRLDLLARGDVLKAQPLLGWQVVLGELMAPWIILTGIQCILTLVAGMLLPGVPGGMTPGLGARIVLMACAVLVAPAISLLGLCLQNAAALLLPAWVLVAPGQSRGGFDQMGQQLVVFGGQMLAFAIALAPAGLAGAVVFALLAWGLGPWLAAPPAALACTAVLLAEAAAAIYAMGRLWDRSDLSREQMS